MASEKVAALGQGAERDRVSGALRDGGGLPGGALRAALAGGARLPRLRPRGFCALKRRQPFQCNRCKHQVGLTAGTVFQDPNAAHHLVFRDLPPGPGKGGISSIELARRLGVKRQTAWLMKQKLMRAMGAREAEKPKLAGRVEVDDAYLGGERAGGKRGRGAAGKTPFVAAVETTAERKPRRLRLTVVKGFRKKEIETLAKRDFAAGSNVVTDGLSCWPAVEKAGCVHFPMVTGSGQQAAMGALQMGQHVLGNIKTAIAGTYHHVSPKHAQSLSRQLRLPLQPPLPARQPVERLACAAALPPRSPIGLVVSDA